MVAALVTAALVAPGLASNVLFTGILCLITLVAGCAIMASRASGRGLMALKDAS